MGRGFSGRTRTSRRLVTDTTYHINVMATRIFEDDLLERTRNELIIEYMKNNTGGLGFVMGFGNTGAAQMLQYDITGDQDFKEYLPYAAFGADSIPKEIIQSIIQNNVEGTSIRMLSTIFNIPDDSTFAKWYLQEYFDYNVGANILFMNNAYYRLDKVEFLPLTDQLKITIKSDQDIFITTSEVTDIRISTINATTDNRNTTVTRRVTYYTDHNYLFSVTTVLSSINVSIPARSEFSSSSSIELPDTMVLAADTEEEFLIDAPDEEENMFIVTYTVPQHGHIRRKFWLYNPEDNIYPQLQDTNSHIAGIKMYPVTMYRNAFYNIDEFNAGPKQIPDGFDEDGQPTTRTVYRPPAVTQQRYEMTERMFNSLGLSVEFMLDGLREGGPMHDLQDAFMMFGVSPSNRSPIVSQSLFRMFDHIYNQFPPIDLNPDNRYSATFNAAPFNLTLQWVANRASEVKTENIGFIGTYTHFPETITTKVPIMETRRKWVDSEWILDEETMVWTWVDAHWVEEEVEIGEIEEITDYIVLKHQFSHTQTRTLYVGNRYSRSETRPEYRTRTVQVWNPERDSHDYHTETYSEMETHPVSVPFAFAHTGISHGTYSGSVMYDAWDTRLVIPLPVYTTEAMSFVERTDLFAHSLHLLFYSYMEHTVSHWEYTVNRSSGWGQWLIMAVVVIIVIIITWATWGTGSGPAASAGSGFFASLSAASVAKAIAIGVGVTLALTLALNLIAKNVKNPHLRAALTVVVFAIAIWASAGTAGAFGTPMNALTTAAQLSTMAVAVNDIYVGEAHAKHMARLGSKIQDIQQQTIELNQEINSFREQSIAISDQYSEIMKKFNSGISTEYMVSLTTEVNLNPHVNKSFAPSMLRYLQTSGYTNFDLLYENTVTNFIPKTMQLGIIDI